MRIPFGWSENRSSSRHARALREACAAVMGDACRHPATRDAPVLFGAAPAAVRGRRRDHQPDPGRPARHAGPLERDLRDRRRRRHGREGHRARRTGHRPAVRRPLGPHDDPERPAGRNLHREQVHAGEQGPRRPGDGAGLRPPSADAALRRRGRSATSGHHRSQSASSGSTTAQPVRVSALDDVRLVRELPDRLLVGTGVEEAIALPGGTTAQSDGPSADTTASTRCSGRRQVIPDLAVDLGIGFGARGGERR